MKYHQVMAFNLFGDKTFEYSERESITELPLNENVGGAICRRFINQKEAFDLCFYLEMQGYKNETIQEVTL